MSKEVVEIRIALEVGIQIVKMQEDGGAPNLGGVCLVLVKSVQFFAVHCLGCVFGDWTEKVGRKISQLQYLPRVLGEAELLAGFLGALRVPVRIETRGRRNERGEQGQESNNLPSHGSR